MAHEAGHAALGTSSSACFQPGAKRPQAERDADRFAAEAVLPEDQVRDSVSGRGVGLAALTAVASRYRVSLEATARRLLEIGTWDAVFIVWRVLSRPGSGAKLRVDWSATPPARRVYIPKHATPPPDLLAQWADRRRGASDVRLVLGSLRGTYRIESVPLDDALLSLIALPDAVRPTE